MKSLMVVWPLRWRCLEVLYFRAWLLNAKIKNSVTCLTKPSVYVCMQRTSVQRRSTRSLVCWWCLWPCPYLHWQATWCHSTALPSKVRRRTLLAFQNWMNSILNWLLVVSNSNTVFLMKMIESMYEKSVWPRSMREVQRNILHIKHHNSLHQWREEVLHANEINLAPSDWFICMYKSHIISFITDITKL